MRRVAELAVEEKTGARALVTILEKVGRCGTLANRHGMSWGHFNKNGGRMGIGWDRGMWWGYTAGRFQGKRPGGSKVDLKEARSIA